VFFVELFSKRTSMQIIKFPFPNPEKQFLKTEWLYAVHATLRKAQINEGN
jgi:hypothetical protein